MGSISYKNRGSEGCREVVDTGQKQVWVTDNSGVSRPVDREEITRVEAPIRTDTNKV